jgi:thioredoxin 1
MALYKTFTTMGGGEEEKQKTDYQVIEINNPGERNNIIRSNKLVVIDYYTDWCGPCKQSQPAYANLAKKYSGHCLLVKENADGVQGTPTPITGVPCFHFYLAGQHIPDATVTGADLEQVEQNIMNLLRV